MTDPAQIEADAALARRLQEEEFGGAPAPPTWNSPSLGDLMAAAPAPAPAPTRSQARQDPQRNPSVQPSPTPQRFPFATAPSATGPEAMLENFVNRLVERGGPFDTDPCLRDDIIAGLRDVPNFPGSEVFFGSQPANAANRPAAHPARSNNRTQQHGRRDAPRNDPNPPPLVADAIPQLFNALRAMGVGVNDGTEQGGARMNNFPGQQQQQSNRQQGQQQQSQHQQSQQQPGQQQQQSQSPFHQQRQNMAGAGGRVTGQDGGEFMEQIDSMLQEVMATTFGSQGRSTTATPRGDGGDTHMRSVYRGRVTRPSGGTTGRRGFTHTGVFPGGGFVLGGSGPFPPAQPRTGGGGSQQPQQQQQQQRDVPNFTDPQGLMRWFLSEFVADDFGGGMFQNTLSDFFRDGVFVVGQNGQESYDDWLNVIERMGGSVNRSATDSEIDGLQSLKYDHSDPRLNRELRDQTTGASSSSGATAAAPAPAASSAAAPEGEIEKCAICLGEYEQGEDMKLLPCEHFFHEECVGRWLKVNRMCPVCKQSIRPGDDRPE